MCLHRFQRCGLSLLEVVLALVILATSMVALGQLMTLGAQHSNNAQDLRRWQQYAASLLDAVAVGAVPLQSTGWTPMETDPLWEYSLEVQENTVDGLKVVIGTVQLIDQQTFSAVPNQATPATTASKPSTASSDWYAQATGSNRAKASSKPSHL